MGFLGFLSRKPSADGAGADTSLHLLKAQRYDATTAALPPIRGKYPVQGNGASILEQFQKSHPNLRDAVNSNAAPPPSIPRIRSDSVDRPSTAPGVPRGWEGPRPRGDSASSRTPRSELRQLPNTKKTGPPYKLPSKAIDTSSANDSKLEVYTLNPPTPSFSHFGSTAASIRSGETDLSKSHGHVDLLEAHSSIKPSDFYGRVKAAGSRNYGEDVADRNMGANGVDMHSGKALEYYKKTFGAIPFDHMEEDDDFDDEDFGRSSRRRRSLGANLRTRSASSHAQLAAASPMRTASRGSRNSHTRSMYYDDEDVVEAGPRGEVKAYEMASRRKSLHSYVGSSSSTNARQPNTSRSRKSRDPEPHNFPESLREKARVAAHDNYDVGKPSKSRPASRSSQQTRSSRKPRDVPRSNYNAPRQVPEFTTYNPNRRHSMSSDSSFEQRPVPPPKPPKRSSRRGPALGPPTPDKGKAVAHRNSFHGSQASSRYDPGEGRSRRPTHQNPTQPAEWGSSRRNLGSTTESHDSPSAYIESKSAAPRQVAQPRRRSKSQAQSVSRSRGLSALSSGGKSFRNSEIEDSIPDRSSSLRKYSITSETATYSSMSSNPFRPQSGHTANTSVDLSPFPPFPKFLNASQSDIASAYYENNNNIEEQPEARMRASSAAQSHRARSTTNGGSISYQQPHLSDFNMDDYISSDDSFGNPRRSRDDEDLLFADGGYGLDYSDLPGLDSLQAPPTPQSSTPDSPRTLAFKAFRDSADAAKLVEESGVASSYLSHPDHHDETPSFTQLNDTAPSESEDNYTSAEEQINFDIPLSRSKDPGFRPAPSRLRYEATQDPIDEEDMDMEEDPEPPVIRIRKTSVKSQRLPTRLDKGKIKATTVN